MSFGSILEQMMQKGASRGSGLDQLLRNLGSAGGSAGGSIRGAGAGSGGGLGGLLSQLEGALRGAGGPGGTGSRSGAGGLGDRAKDFFGKEQVGGLNTGQLGGIGAIAGALLGGGAKGAVKGGAMAILGTLAINAIRAARQEGQTPDQPRALQHAPAPGQPAEPVAADAPPAPEEVASVTGPEAERLMLIAMISAAKADGSVDESEMRAIIGKAGEGEVTDEEKLLIMSELAKPVDIDALAAQVTSPAQAAAVYAASLLTTSPESPAEREYLAKLASALNLDPAAVAELEKTAGTVGV